MAKSPQDEMQRYNSPTMPRRNVDWIEVIVKWTRYDHVAIYDYPTTTGSETLVRVYTGDMMVVSRKYRKDDWCLCQAGHMLGWVFLKDLKFMRSHKGSTFKIKLDTLDIPAHIQAVVADPCDLETQEALPVCPDDETDLAETQEAFAAPVLPEDEYENITLDNPLPMPPLDDDPPAAPRHTQASIAPANKSIINRLIHFFKR